MTIELHLHVTFYEKLALLKNSNFRVFNQLRAVLFKLTVGNAHNAHEVLLCLQRVLKFTQDLNVKRALASGRKEVRMRARFQALG